MMKKSLLLIGIICVMLAFVSCSSKKKSTEIPIESWDGVYVFTDEETQEIKIATITNKSEDTFNVKCECIDGEQSFDVTVKDNKKRYLAVNIGEKTIKLSISSDYDYLVIDDMWTGEAIESRTHNWSGKYFRHPEGEPIPSFVNPSEQENSDK